MTNEPSLYLDIMGTDNDPDDDDDNNNNLELFTWESLRNIYELRIDLINWLSEKYHKFELREYFSTFDVTLFCWYLFLYLVILGLGWFSWFWRLVFLVIFVVNQSECEANRRRIQLRHALAIAKDEELRILKRDIEERAWRLKSLVKEEDQKQQNGLETAELLNKILTTAWPYVESWTRVLMSQIEASIHNQLSNMSLSIIPGVTAQDLVGLKFDKVNLGECVPNIGRVAFRRGESRVAVDLEIEFISGPDCEVAVKANGLSPGISQIQFTGILRLEAGPLLAQPPFLECLSIYFLDIPILDCVPTGVPIANGIRKRVIQYAIDIIKDIVVYPNIIRCPMIPITSLRAPQPFGVILLNVERAEGLKNADVIGYSDPYCIVSQGAWQVQSHYINNDLNPVWNFFTMVVIRWDPLLGGQMIKFLVKDYDKSNQDDDLLSTHISVRKIYDNKDIILINKLCGDDVIEQGSLFIRAAWLDLSSKLSDLDQSHEIIRINESRSSEYKRGSGEVFTSVLMVWLVSANNIEPFDVELFASLKLGNVVKTSVSVPRSSDKAIWPWMQDFIFNIVNPYKEELEITVYEKYKERPKGKLKIPLSGDLLKSSKLQINEKPYRLEESTPGATVTLGLTFRTIDLQGNTTAIKKDLLNYSSSETNIDNNKGKERKKAPLLNLVPPFYTQDGTMPLNKRKSTSTYDVSYQHTGRSPPSSPDSETYSLPDEFLDPEPITPRRQTYDAHELFSGQQTEQRKKEKKKFNLFNIVRIKRKYKKKKSS